MPRCGISARCGDRVPARRERRLCPPVLALHGGALRGRVQGTPPSLSLYTLLLIISAVSFGKPATPLMGFSRYVFVAFPLFMTLATILESRKAMGVWLSFSAVVSLVFCAFFVSWRFVA